MTTLATLKQKFLPGLAPEDFFVLIASITGKDKAFLLAHDEYPLSHTETTKAETYFQRRLKHEPVAYIIGHKEFYGRDFLVNNHTLIPRPETELLIEKAKEYCETISGPLDIIDVGTGSGNIIITLAEELDDALLHFFGIDLAPEALAVAKENATHLTKKDINFLQSDLLTSYLSLHTEKNFLIAANLPYLSQEVFEQSASDVREYEPYTALFSEDEGLAHYYALLDQIASLSKTVSSGTFFFEISPEQAPVLTSYIQKHFPNITTTIFRDLTGRERLIQGTLSKK